jgi:hypothetical protein
MKTPALYLMACIILNPFFIEAVTAQANSQYASVTDVGNGKEVVTICAPRNPGQNSQYYLSSNQVVTINSYGFPTASGLTMNFANGSSLSYGFSTTITSGSEYTFTGVTNITLAASSYVTFVTFTIFTPSTNYLSVIPTGSVVIPSDATGPVRIILESSSDLINWVPSLPGTYGSTYTNRFFRVRAVAQ